MLRSATDSFQDVDVDAAECSAPPSGQRLTPSAQSNRTPSIVSAPTTVYSTVTGASGAGLSSGDTPRSTPSAVYYSPFIPTFTQDYFQRGVVAYNIMSMLPRKLTIAWMPFATGMTYVHHFAEHHGWRVDPVLLACAAFLLAGKAENYGQIRAYRIVKAVFELDAKRPEQKEHADIRRQQILTAEMMLFHALEFNVVVSLPYSRMEALLEAAAPSPGKGGVGTTQEPMSSAASLKALSQKLLAYTYMSPLCVHMHGNTIADGIVTMVAEAIGVLDELQYALSDAGLSLSISTADLEGLKQTIYAVLVLSGKKVGVEAIDNVVRFFKKRGGHTRPDAAAGSATAAA